MNTEFKYDHYYDYEEITSHLMKHVQDYPELITVEALSETLEGRKIWAVTLSDKSGKPADQKSAFYMDGNTHAGEVSGSMACMHMIDYILTNSKDEEIAGMLKNQTFYFIPRISPDGSEEYLKTANTVRSINQVYPADQRENHGLKPQDLDDNNKILMMRVKSPVGAWKKKPGSEFLMTKREPDDTVGEFYNIYSEGLIDEYNGVNITMARPIYAMDYNRNFPISWMPDAQQPGAGEYPLSHIETQTMAKFILTHRNISAIMTMHTSGGALLHPPGTHSEKLSNGADMKMYKEIGAMADRKLKYPTCNLFDAYCVDPAHFDAGAFDDWCFLTQGIPSMTMEIWNIKETAGCDKQWPVNRNKTQAMVEEENEKVLNWLKENSPKAILPWKEFSHPQLGTVELGGVDYKFATQNPPEHLLQNELEKILDFTMRYAKVLPKLHFGDTTVTKEAEGVYKIETSVYNDGFLPTWLSYEARGLKNDRPVYLELKGADVITGPKKVAGLAGFHNINTSYGYGNNINTNNHEAFAEKLVYTVKASAGTKVVLSAVNERAGTAETEIVL